MTFYKLQGAQISTDRFPTGNALVLAAHPDDECFGCGGAIMRHIAQNDQVKVVIFTDGAASPGIDCPKPEYIRRRRNESIGAAAILGYGLPEFLDYSDGNLQANEALESTILQFINDFQPLNIYLPSSFEAHPDHVSLYHSALNAALLSGRQLCLFYYEISQTLIPDRLLDITDLQQTLEKAMACYKSQTAIQPYDIQMRSLHIYRSYLLEKHVHFAEAYQFTLLPQTITTKKLINPQNTSGKHPLVSVIVRSMNRAELSLALNSIENQSYEHIEVVIVDATGKGDIKINQEDYRFSFTIISASKQLDRSAAANAGLDAVGGDYICFLDEDDLMLPEHIQQLVSALNTSDALVAYDNIERVDKSFRKELTYNKPFEADHLLAENYIPNLALLINKSLIDKGCRFDERFPIYEDWDFILQLVQFTDFVQVSKPGGFYRSIGTSGVQQPNYETIFYRKKILEKWLGKCDNERFNSFAGKFLTTQETTSPLLRCQLFWADDESRIDETHSVIVWNRPNEKKVIFDLPQAVSCKHLRFDPMDTIGQISLESISLSIDNKNVECNVSVYSNALEESENSFFFSHADAQIHFQLSEANTFDKVTIHFHCGITGAAAIHYSSILNEKHIQSMQKNLEAKSLLLHEADHLKQTLENQLASAEKELSELNSNLKKTELACEQKAADLRNLQSELTQLNHKSELDHLLIVNVTAQNKSLSQLLQSIQHNKTYRLSKHLTNLGLMLRPWCWVPALNEERSLRKHEKILTHSGLWNENYYLTKYPDVGFSELSAVRHYIKFGAFEGRNPSEDFDSVSYLSNNPDVVAAHLNPLLHYLQHGKNEGRKISRPAENTHDTASNTATSAPFTKSKPDSLKHNIDHEIKEIEISGLFDAHYYLNVNTDVRNHGYDPLTHYCMHGWREFRNPSFKFDTHFYLSSYEDVRASGINPLLHYVRAGKAEGRLSHKPEIIESDMSAQADIRTIVDSLQQTENLRIAVVLHLFHLDLLDEFLPLLENLPSGFHLFVSTTTEIKPIAAGRFYQLLPEQRVRIIVQENRGRDIAPFIYFLKNGLTDFDLVLKIHSKKSDFDPLLKGWRTYLLGQLAGSRAVVNTLLRAFSDDPMLGMVWPVVHPYIQQIGLDEGWGAEKSMEKTHAIARCCYPQFDLPGLHERFVFPAGSMFWARPQALIPLLEYQPEIFSFEPESGQTDGTLAHTIERMFGIVPAKTGFTTKTVFFGQKQIHPEQRINDPEGNAAHILFVAHDLFHSGAQTVLLNIIRWLHQHTGFKISTLALKKGNDGGKMTADYRQWSALYLLDELQANVTFDMLPQQLKSLLGKVDLIYGNTILSAEIYPLLSAFNTPIITHIHELERSIGKYSSAAVRARFAGDSAALIACAEVVKQNLLSNHQPDSEKIHLIHEFIQPFDVGNKRHSIRQKMGWRDDEIIVIGCGTMYWRKGTDLFIETAIKVKQAGITQVRFCWTGPNYWDADNNGLGLWADWEKKIEDNKMGEQLVFLGEVDNSAGYFAAADVFFLSSREDPYPLVGLEAAFCGLPVICFEGGGGMSELVEDKAGFVVPFEDSAAVAAKIMLLAADAELRKGMGANAMHKVKSRHLTDKAMPEVLRLMRRTAQIKPVVSVIIPTYNQAAFLRERIESVLNQHFRDVEIIVLDDASEDETPEITNTYNNHPLMKIIRSETNSGSPFAQWQKGIELASGSLIWIAEGDDLAEPDFLSKLIPAFANPNVKMAYCASHVIDSEGQVHKDYYRRNGHYEKLGFPATRWDESHLSDGFEEIKQALSIRNTIPNVSAVVFRKTALQNLDFGEARSFKTAGDWYIYLSLLPGGQIAYVAEALNYHRRHNNSVVGTQSRKAEKTLEEYYRIHDYVISRFEIGTETVEKMIASVEEGLKKLWPESQQASAAYDGTVLRQKNLSKLQK